MCPEVVAQEFMDRLQTAGWKMDGWTVDSLVQEIKAKKRLQDVIIHFVYYWVMNFVLPCLSTSFSYPDQISSTINLDGSNGQRTEPERENHLSSEVGNSCIDNILLCCC